MKKKLSLLLAMVLAMTMVMGIGVTAYAYTEVGHISIYIDTDAFIPGCSPIDVISVTGDGIDFDNSLIAIYDLTRDVYTNKIIAGNEYSLHMQLQFQSDRNVSGDTFSDCECNIGVDSIELVDWDMNIPPQHDDTDQLCIMTNSFYPTEGPTPPSNPDKSLATAHVHNFQWQTIYEATPNSDGLEGEVCSCGATRNTSVISAMDYAVNKYADQMIKAAKPGQKITLEFGEFNSFPRYMMEKVAARMNENITFVFKFKQNKKMQTVTIEPGTAIDLQYDWYGPDKMKELYGAE